MQVKLSVQERLLILNIIPAEENVVTLRIVKKLRDDLTFKEDELKEFGIEIKDGRVTWKKSVDRKVEIGGRATDIITEALKKLSDTKKLTEAHLSLYDKFVENKTDETPKE